MVKLLDILLEAPLTPQAAASMVDSGTIVSLYVNNKWIKNVLPVSVEDKDGESYLTADVKKDNGSVERESFKISDIKNINRSSKKTSFDDDSKKKEKPKKAAKPVPKKSSDPIEDDIINNRAVSIYYKGDRQNKPGWRTILPVAYGSHSSKTYGEKDYIRAWQWKGDTVRGIPKWKLFRVDRITNWNRSSTTVIKDVPDPRYNPDGDKWMDTIYAVAKFEVDESRSKKKRKLKEALVTLVRDIIND